MISPHGGKLIKKIFSEEQKQEVLSNIGKFQWLSLDFELAKDVKNIARGVFSPLEGFLTENDFKSVVLNMRLANGIVWPIPIVLSISQEDMNRLKNEKEILLFDQEQNPLAILRNPEIYSYDKDFFVENVFGTKDKEHAGVADVYKMNDYLLGGEIWLLEEKDDQFPDFSLSPEQTRNVFKEKGWDKVVAFQTRNVPHCGHEFLQRKASEMVDGLFIQPVVGEKKMDDFKDEYIVASYEVLLDRYFPRDKVVLGVLPLKMRYAGPREAVLHALIRKNFGCTHFIVGRDHAGVGNYYPPFAAQEIFNNFAPNEVEIEIMKFPEVLFCPECQNHVFLDGCSHENKISFSGTKLRKLLSEKQQPPTYILRPEVYYFLANSENSLVDELYKRKNKKQEGFVLWFTGLSQSGKTTTADAVNEVLTQRGIKTERLDGDVVRQYLSSDLGFSKEDRDENIRRIGFVSGLLSKNGRGVVCSFISPYKESRDLVRLKTKNFVEVFCNCPIEVCEARDQKGLYKKARAGEIKAFTGISDPYEAPENPEIELNTDKETTKECVDKIINYLESRKLI